MKNSFIKDHYFPFCKEINNTTYYYQNYKLYYHMFTLRERPPSPLEVPIKLSAVPSKKMR